MTLFDTIYRSTVLPVLTYYNGRSATGVYASAAGVETDPITVIAGVRTEDTEPTDVGLEKTIRQTWQVRAVDVPNPELNGRLTIDSVTWSVRDISRSGSTFDLACVQLKHQEFVKQGYRRQ